MAIRFEPACDDNVLWSIVPPCGPFPDSRRPDHPISMSPSMDIRYQNELSDQDRRTSNCSPQVCEQGAVERFGRRDFVRSPSEPNQYPAHFYPVPPAPGHQVMYKTRLNCCAFNEPMNCKFHDNHVPPILTYDVPKSSSSALDLSRTSMSHRHGFESSQGELYKAKFKRNTHRRNSVNDVSYKEYGYTNSMQAHARDGQPKDRTRHRSVHIPVDAARNAKVRKQNGDVIQRSSASGVTRKAEKTGLGVKIEHSVNKELKQVAESFAVVSKSDDVASVLDTEEQKARAAPSSEKQSAASQSSKIVIAPAADKFQESDAAEALLGLREGFYGAPCSKDNDTDTTVDAGTSRSDNSSASIAVNPDQPSTSHANIPGFNPTDVRETNHSPNDLVDEERTFNDVIRDDATAKANGGDVQSSAKHRCHFKKRICQKFAASLDQIKQDCLPESSTSNAAESSNLTRPTSQNGDGHGEPDSGHDLPSSTKSSDYREFSRKPDRSRPKTKEKLNRNVFDENSKAGLSKRRKTEKRRIDKDDDVKATKTMKQKEKVLEKINSNEKQQTKTLSSKQDDAGKQVSRVKDQRTKATSKSKSSTSNGGLATPKVIRVNSNKTKSKSNLYRVTSSLGSSCESLASEDVAHDVIVSESSSSDYSTDSDTDGDDSSKVDVTVTKETVTSSIITSRKQEGSPQRKAFILSKPKFSLPCKKSDDPEKKPTFLTPPSAPSPAFAKKDPVLINPVKPASPFPIGDGEKVKVAPKSAPSLSPSSKQNGFQIKKATFTFQSSGKQDDAPRTTVTSQCSVSFDQTQHADKSTFRFDREKMLRESTTKEKAIKRGSWKMESNFPFGTLSEGISFETLSKPNAAVAEDSGITKKTANQKSKSHHLPYNKDRLPRPTARPTALEAEHHLLRTKKGKKRGPSADSWPKNREVRAATSAKRLKLQEENMAKKKERVHDEATKTRNESNSKVSEKKIASELKTGKLAMTSSSRRKPSRVFKHHKYSTLKINPSQNNPSEDRGLSEFSLISRPLGLEHREMLAKSFEPDANPDAWSTDSIASRMSSSAASSRTSSLADDENDGDVIKTAALNSPNLRKRRHKRHRQVSAAETGTKSELLKRKQKKLFSESRCQGRQGANNVRGAATSSRATSAASGSTFKLLSLFPAPASLIAGHAAGELCPGYGATGSGQRSSLPLRWRKGEDISELKQKRQRDRWRSLTLDMFCLGATS
ncbi:uncharacterized protein LOC143451937 [Clavelina lepadiformis]|uniref:uncharacterized protein LOC143451937 n=1 Tax=Clavelina lepadiformis TaxID=159417 RepID=UPI0040411342